jgi:hypothetical protein
MDPEVTEVSTEESELEAAFAEASVDATPSGSESIEAQAKETPSTEVQPAAKEKETPSKETETPEKKGEETPSEDSVDSLRVQLADLQKQRDDNKAWATKLSQELAELKKGNAGAGSGQEDLPEKVKEFYADYPEAREAVAFEAARLLQEKLGGVDLNQLAQVSQSLAGEVAQQRFDAAVITGFDDGTGNWVDGHPDAPRIFRTQEFKDFVTEKKLELDKVTSPADAIKILTDFKAAKIGKAAGESDKGKQTKAKALQDQAAGALKGGTSGKSASSAPAASSFEDAFEEALKD